MEDNYVEYDGYEPSLEEILIFWVLAPVKAGELEPLPIEDRKTIACGPSESRWPESWPQFYLHGTTGGPARATSERIPLYFGKAGEDSTEVEPGDRIYYRGEGVFELVKRGSETV